MKKYIELLENINDTILLERKKEPKTRQDRIKELKIATQERKEKKEAAALATMSQQDSSEESGRYIQDSDSLGGEHYYSDLDSSNDLDKYEQEIKTKSRVEGWTLYFPIKIKIEIDNEMKKVIESLHNIKTNSNEDNNLFSEVKKSLKEIKESAQNKLTGYKRKYKEEIDILITEIILKKYCHVTHNIIKDIDVTFSHELHSFNHTRNSSVKKFIDKIKEIKNESIKTNNRLLNDLIDNRIESFVSDIDHLMTVIYKQGEFDRKDIGKSFDISKLPEDFKSENIDTQTIYVFQTFIKNKYRIFTKTPNKHIALSIKEYLLKLKNDKKLIEQFKDDRIFLEIRLDDLIHLIDKFTQNVEEIDVNNKHFKTFMHLFNIDKLTPHHKNYTFIDDFALYDEKNICFEETKNFLNKFLSQEKKEDLVNLQYPSQKVIITLNYLNKNIFKLSKFHPSKSIETLKKYSEYLIDTFESKSKENFENENIKTIIQKLLQIAKMTKTLTREPNKLNVVLNSIYELLTGTKEKQYLTSVQGIFIQNEIRTLMQKLRLSEENIKTKNISFEEIIQDKDVEKAINFIAAGVHEIYSKHNLCKEFLIDMIEALAAPSRSNEKISNFYIIEDINLVISDYERELGREIEKKSFMEKVFKNKEIDEEIKTAFKKSYDKIKEKNISSPSKVKTVLYDNFDKLLFGKENKIEKMEFEFRVEKFLEQRINTITIKGISTLKDFFSINLKEMAMSMHEEFENNNIELVLRIIDSYMDSIKLSYEILNKFINEQKESIDNFFVKKGSVLENVSSIEEDNTQLMNDIKNKIIKFLTDNNLLSSSEQKRLTSGKIIPIIESIETVLRNYLCEQTIKHVENINSSFKSKQDIGMQLSYQNLIKKLKEQIIIPTLDKPIGLDYYVSKRIKELKQIYSQKFETYIKMKESDLESETHLKIPKSVEIFNTFFGNPLNQSNLKKLDKGEIKKTLVDRLKDVIKYNDYTIDVIDQVSSFIDDLQQEKIEKIEVNEFIKKVKNHINEKTGKLMFNCILPNDISKTTRKLKQNELEISLKEVSGVDYELFDTHKNENQKFISKFVTLEIDTDGEHNIDLEQFKKQLRTKKIEYNSFNTKLEKLLDQKSTIKIFEQFLHDVIGGKYTIKEANDYFIKTKNFNIGI